MKKISYDVSRKTIEAYLNYISKIYGKNNSGHKGLNNKFYSVTFHALLFVINSIHIIKMKTFLRTLQISLSYSRVSKLLWCNTWVMLCNRGA